MEELTYKDMGLSDEEYASIVKIMGRKPNFTETGMWSVMWSEHCGYKNSRPLLKDFPTTGERVIHGPGENAGVVDIGDNQAVVFKIESHNHPSAIEPYEGAATGVGGIVRDVFAMGARPIALLDSLRLGKLSEPQVQELFTGIAAGIADYGKVLGVPTVAGEVYFDQAYEGNPLVNAMAVGLVNQDEIALAEANEVGAVLVLAGAKTGRDGIHGATFASENLSDESAEKRTAMHPCDPLTEKLLIEACLELIKEDLVSGMQDLGAAGLTSSVSETASKQGRGVEVDVLQVPRREADMTAYEIMLSESQERMLVVPRRGAEQRTAEIFAKWGVEATVIGRVTDDGIFRVREGEQVVAEIPVMGLTDCPTYVREGVEPEYYHTAQKFEQSTLNATELSKDLPKLLASPNIASKRWIYEQYYDRQAMADVVLPPGAADAGVLRIPGTPKGIALASDGNGRMTYLNPYRGAMLAVCETARNLACTGAKPLALSNCLNFGNPEHLDVYWQMQQVIAGISAAATALSTPVVSGNVSLYNETAEKAIFPTPIIGMVGLLPEVDKHCGSAFTKAGDQIVLLGEWRTELGGSEYLAVIHGLETGEIPWVDLEQEKNLQALLLTLIRDIGISSCHDISDGGLAVALAESAIQGNLGAEIVLPTTAVTEILFSEAPSRAVVSVDPAKLESVAKAGAELGIKVTVLGSTGGSDLIFRQPEHLLYQVPVAEARDIWQQSIEENMPKSKK